MIKREELSNPNSCMSKARDDEMIFVLLARDAAAPVAIQAWINERIRIGKNHPDDPQIMEAKQCARKMQARLCDMCGMIHHPDNVECPCCCSNCGGEKDSQGWCANYCTDAEKAKRKD